MLVVDHKNYATRVPGCAADNRKTLMNVCTSSIETVQGLEVLFDSRRARDVDDPEVTIVIPMYNVKAYIDECLGGVLSAVETVGLEVILIDDGSADGTAGYVLGRLEDLRPPEVFLVRQANRGLSAVRNLGATLARGEYLGFFDSDDLMVTGSLRVLLDFARHNGCDLVMGRSFVFDSTSQEVSPFYDAWAWDRLLSGARSRVISRHEDYQLFFLEPNANYRLLRREYFLAQGFIYPDGRLFEDPPVHFEMLARAQRIGLLDVPYYGYRVNRPGKITEERSRRRFDILEVAKETFRKLGGIEISVDAGGALVYSMARIVWWCGTMTLPEDRAVFFEAAVSVFDKVPEVWIAAFKRLYFPDEILHLVMGTLRRKDIPRLVELSQKRRNPLRSALYLVRLGRWDLFIRHLRSALGRRVAWLSRKFK